MPKQQDEVRQETKHRRRSAEGLPDVIEISVSVDNHDELRTYTYRAAIQVAKMPCAEVFGRWCVEVFTAAEDLLSRGAEDDDDGEGWKKADA